jgi:RNA polymerase sigma-70 factor (ECF subfamily)
LIEFRRWGRKTIGEVEPVDNPFQDLLRRVRAGNQDAAEEVVRRYRPLVLRVIRLHPLFSPGLERRCGPSDICQSVLASFFFRVGQFKLETEEDLQKLLATMARNKVINQANRQRATRRDYRKTRSFGLDEKSPEPSPSQKAAVQELVQKAHDLLSEEEQRLLQLRGQGCEWAAIAVELGGTPESLRKKLERALRRVEKLLGID